MEACEERRVKCRSCPVLLVLCPPPLDPLLAPGAEQGRGAIRSAPPGVLASGYEDDWSRAYYTYRAPGGGGFYMEACMDALDEPGCGDMVVPLLVSWLSSIGVPPQHVALLQQILSRKVFTA